MVTTILSIIRQFLLTAMLTTVISALKRMVLMGVFILGITVACLAAAAPPPADPGDINPDAGAGDTSSSSVPIDGGLSLLLAAGAGYGAKRLAKKRKEKLKRNENVWDYAKP